MQKLNRQRPRNLKFSASTFRTDSCLNSKLKQMNYPLIDNIEKKQYEFHIDGDLARIEYIKAQGKIFLTHTEVPAKFEGKGIGSALVRQVLDDIQQEGLILVPLCPFVAAYLNRHPEYNKLLSK